MGLPADRKANETGEFLHSVRKYLQSVTGNVLYAVLTYGLINLKREDKNERDFREDFKD